MENNKLQQIAKVIVTVAAILLASAVLNKAYSQERLVSFAPRVYDSGLPGNIYFGNGLTYSNIGMPIYYSYSGFDSKKGFFTEEKINEYRKFEWDAETRVKTKGWYLINEREQVIRYGNEFVEYAEKVVIDRNITVYKLSKEKNSDYVCLHKVSNLFVVWRRGNKEMFYLSEKAMKTGTVIENNELVIASK